MRVSASPGLVQGHSRQKSDQFREFPRASVLEFGYMDSPWLSLTRTMTCRCLRGVFVPVAFSSMSLRWCIAFRRFFGGEPAEAGTPARHRSRHSPEEGGGNFPQKNSGHGGSVSPAWTLLDVLSEIALFCFFVFPVKRSSKSVTSTDYGVGFPKRQEGRSSCPLEHANRQTIKPSGLVAAGWPSKCWKIGDC
jgi:hypothetical protein